MKTIRLEEPGRLVLTSTQRPPSLEPEEALVRVHRIGVCGTECGYALVPGYAGNRDAGRAVPDDCADVGGGGQPGDEEDSAAKCGHVPGEQHAVCAAAGGRDSDCGRADVLPGAELGADFGASADAGGDEFLRGRFEVRGKVQDEGIPQGLKPAFFVGLGGPSLKAWLT